MSLLFPSIDICYVSNDLPLADIDRKLRGPEYFLYSEEVSVNAFVCY
jgi:hypothetical protein